jgi:hypothetical protein
MTPPPLAVMVATTSLNLGHTGAVVNDDPVPVFGQHQRCNRFDALMAPVISAARAIRSPLLRADLGHIGLWDEPRDERHPTLRHENSA